MNFAGVWFSEDHMLHAEQADAVGTCRGRSFGGFRDGDVDLDLRRGHRFDRRLRTNLLDRFGLLIGFDFGSLEHRALVTVERDDLTVLEGGRGVGRPDNGGDAQFARDDGGVAGHAALIGDDARGPLHRGHHVGHRHLGDDDVALADLVEVVELDDDPRGTADRPRTRAEPVDEHVAGATRVGPVSTAALGGLHAPAAVGQSLAASTLPVGSATSLPSSSIVVIGRDWSM